MTFRVKVIVGTSDAFERAELRVRGSRICSDDIHGSISEFFSLNSRPKRGLLGPDVAIGKGQLYVAGVFFANTYCGRGFRLGFGDSLFVRS